MTAAVFETNCNFILIKMKNIFYYLIYGIIITGFLAAIVGIPKEIKNIIFDDGLAQAQSGSGESSGCGKVTYEVSCSGSVLTWCENQQVKTFDCSQYGLTCALKDNQTGYNCISSSEDETKEDNGGGGTGDGDAGESGGDDSESSYSLDYCGSCEGLYCYNAPGAHICKDETKIKSGQQTIISLRNEILYYRNRILAEKADLLLEINRLQKKIDYYEQKINAQNIVIQQLQSENAKELERLVLSDYEKIKQETEKEKATKEELVKRFDNLAKPNGLIDQLAAEIPKTSDQIDKCFKEGVDECDAECDSDSGCHDTLGCEPDDCSGGTPSVCSIDNSSTIQDLKSKIDSEIQAILDIIGGVGQPTPGGPSATTTTGTTTDQQARSDLSASGIGVNKTCQNSSSCSVSGGQTCLNGLQSSTVSGIKTIKQNCNCDVTITGGTECGHSASGTYNHGNGYKTDLRTNAALNNYIQQQGCSTTPQDTNCTGKDGNIYRYETAGGAHWDVCYGCPT